MKIYRISQSFDNLQHGTIVLSDLYRREGQIKILDKEIKNSPFGDKTTYRCLFTGSDRNGYLEPRDITKIVK
jgi:hypothetical protein